MKIMTDLAIKRCFNNPIVDFVAIKRCFNSHVAEILCASRQPSRERQLDEDLSL